MKIGNMETIVRKQIRVTLIDRVTKQVFRTSYYEYGTEITDRLVQCLHTAHQTNNLHYMIAEYVETTQKQAVIIF